ncbi:hypothetical protein GUJ93_ZPchr0013g38014 [Zizania palustris]|uniref:Uncharacterized protein n=1 Tax=Zizania palustris TaxID=103762 RepID=A0A8J6BYS6_ZIZPA|nr:hypothetical protein GUJ93_ZPchr0013g38014 [Zizania palustris]
MGVDRSSAVLGAPDRVEPRTLGQAELPALVGQLGWPYLVPRRARPRPAERARPRRPRARLGRRPEVRAGPFGHGVERRWAWARVEPAEPPDLVEQQPGSCLFLCVCIRVYIYSF